MKKSCYNYDIAKRINNGEAQVKQQSNYPDSSFVCFIERDNLVIKKLKRWTSS